MKLSKRFKKMKTSAKLSLVGTALYTATLATPLYAAVKEEVKPVEKINLEQVITTEQADILYKEKLAEYASDKLLKNAELENLYSINFKKINILENEKTSLDQEYKTNTKKSTEDLENKIKEYRNQFVNRTQVSVFEDVKENFNDEVLRYYSALIDSDRGNIIYPANTLLEPKLNKVFKKIVIEADKVFKEQYNLNCLDILLEKNEYNINDVLTLYNLIKDNDKHAFKINELELQQKIKDLEELKSRKVEIAKEQNKALENKIDDVSNKIQEIVGINSNFEKYFIHKVEVENFEVKYGNWNNSIGFSMAAAEVLKKRGLKVNGWDPMDCLSIAKEEFDQNQEKIIDSLAQYFNAEGFDVEIEKLGNPAKMKINWGLAWLLGLALPVARNFIITRYVDGRDADYVFPLALGLGNGIAGFVILDGIHPLMFPARMIIPPFIFQPARKIMKVMRERKYR